MAWPGINPDGTIKPTGDNGANYGVRDGEEEGVTFVGSGDSLNLVDDSESSLAGKIMSIMNSKLSTETKDYLVQYFMNENLSKNAFNREYEASKQQYQNAVEDLKKAGISPFLAFDGLRSASASSSSGSVSGGLGTQTKNAKASLSADLSGKLFTVLAIIAAAAIRFLA